MQESGEERQSEFSSTLTIRSPFSTLLLYCREAAMMWRLPEPAHLRRGHRRVWIASYPQSRCTQTLDCGSRI